MRSTSLFGTFGLVELSIFLGRTRISSYLRLLSLRLLSVATGQRQRSRQGRGKVETGHNLSPPL